MSASASDPPSRQPPGAIVKHSLTIAGHRTSISLEAAFWNALREIAARRELPLAALVREIDDARGEANLSSAIRVFVLRDAQQSAQISSGPFRPDR